MKKVYDILVQCGVCNGEVDHFLSEEKPEVGQQTTLGVCHKCGQEDDEYGVITAVDVDRTITDPAELEELFPGERLDGVEVVSVTAWAVPSSLYPEREWFTVKEVAEQLGMSKDTLWTKMKRREFHGFQVRGYIQSAGSVTFIHRRVVDEIRRRQK